jgi:hypothetical protein
VEPGSRALVCAEHLEAKNGEGMTDDYYTLTSWRVKEGRLDDFLAAWRSLGDAFFNLDRPPRRTTLLQSSEDPLFFYSFGPWGALEDIEAMRTDARAQQAFTKLAEVCETSRPGVFRLAHTLPG